MLIYMNRFPYLYVEKVGEPHLLARLYYKEITKTDWKEAMDLFDRDGNSSHLKGEKN